MKVLHVIPSISPQRGGPSQAVLQMVRVLRQKGVDAEIITTTDNGIYRNNNLPIGRWFEYEHVPLLIFQSETSRFRIFREYLFSLPLTEWLIKNIRTYDLLHVHALFSYPSTIAMLIARFRGVPYMVRTIGQLSTWSLQQGSLQKKIMLSLVEKSNLNSSTFIHVTSKSEENDLVSLGIKNRKLLLSLGVDLPDVNVIINSKKDNLESKHIRYLYLSRIHKKKQIELLFHGFGILKNSYGYRNWNLSIAGAGDEMYLYLLHKLAHDLNISDHLCWYGHVTGDFKRILLRDSDWFVLTSANENFGISAVEAMASLLPVILSDQVGIADQVIDFGAGIICKENIDDIANALRKSMTLSSHPIGLAARRLAETKYSWPTIADSLVLAYNASIKSGET